MKQKRFLAKLTAGPEPKRWRRASRTRRLLRRLRVFLVRRRRRVLRISAVLAVAGGICLILLTVSLPYYVFRPGDVTLGTDAIKVSGTEVHAPTNGIGFVTISVRGPLSPAQWLAASLDDRMSIVPSNIFNRNLPAEQRREDDLRLMNVSHDVAKFVAFNELEFDLSSLIEIVIRGIIPCSAADGILGMGDTILSAYGEQMKSIAELQEVIKDQAIGDVLEIEVRSLLSGETETHTIPLGSRNDPCLEEAVGVLEEQAKPFLGVTLEERAQSEDVCSKLHVCVEFDVGNVGGPSAGLVFTLTIIDLLTPGDLSGECLVAATGTILSDGNVGGVGGVMQKAVAAERDGYHMMLVPSAHGADARSALRGSMVVMEVGSVKDALSAIELCAENTDLLTSQRPGVSSE